MRHNMIVHRILYNVYILYIYRVNVFFLGIAEYTRSNKKMLDGCTILLE